MSESLEYRRLLESQLIEEFKEKFYQKLGYYPQVLTKFDLCKTTERNKSITLEKLKQYFNPFLPVINYKKYQLGSPARFRELVDLRHIYSYLARKIGYSLTDIAKSLNNRDHTTVINSIKKFENLIATDHIFKEKYIRIINHIKNIDNEPSALEDKLEVSN